MILDFKCWTGWSSTSEWSHVDLILKISWLYWRSESTWPQNLKCWNAVNGLVLNIWVITWISSWQDRTSEISINAFKYCGKRTLDESINLIMESSWEEYWYHYQYSKYSPGMTIGKLQTCKIHICFDDHNKISPTKDMRLTLRLLYKNCGNLEAGILRPQVGLKFDQFLTLLRQY